MITSHFTTTEVSNLQAERKKQFARGFPVFSRVLVAPIPTTMIDILSSYLRPCEWIDIRVQRVKGVIDLEDCRGSE